MTTWRWSGLQAACSTIASVIARTSLRFCSTVRPSHISTTTNGIMSSLGNGRGRATRLLNVHDSAANAAPLAAPDRNRRARTETASPDEFQSEFLSRIAIDAARRSGKVYQQSPRLHRRKKLPAHELRRHAGNQNIRGWQHVREFAQFVRLRARSVGSGALHRIAGGDMDPRSQG